MELQGRGEKQMPSTKVFNQWGYVYTFPLACGHTDIMSLQNSANFADAMLRLGP